MEVLELDEVPDLGERGGDDRGFSDGGGGWDAGRHCELLLLLIWVSEILPLFFGDE